MQGWGSRLTDEPIALSFSSEPVRGGIQNLEGEEREERLGNARAHVMKISSEGNPATQFEAHSKDLISDSSMQDMHAKQALGIQITHKLAVSNPKNKQVITQMHILPKHFGGRLLY